MASPEIDISELLTEVPRGAEGVPYRVVEQRNGAEAQEAAQAVFARHASQRFPGVTDAPVFTPVDQVVKTAQYTLDQRSLFTYRQGWAKEFQIPLTVRDTFHTIQTRNGGLLLYVDHTNCIVPTEETFAEVKKNNTRPEVLVINAFESLGYPSDPASFTPYLDGFAQTAARVGMEFDPNWVESTVRYQEKEGKGAPMHTYLALPPGDRDTEATRHYVRMAARKYSHRTGEDTGIPNPQLLPDHLTSPDGLLYLAQYDVFPNSGNPREFQLQTAQLVWESLRNGTPNAEVDLQNIPEEIRMQYIAMVYGIVGRRQNRESLFLPRIPGKTYKGYVLSGLAQYGAATAIGDQESTEKIIGTTNPDTSLSARVHDALVLPELLIPEEQAEAVATRPAQEWLRLSGQHKILEEAVSDYWRKDNTWPAGLLGKRFSHKPKRLTRDDVLPQVPYTTVIETSGRNEYQRSAPVWSLLLTRQYEPDREVGPGGYAQAFRDTVEMLGSDFYQRQITGEARPQATALLGIIANDLDALAADRYTTRDDTKDTIARFGRISGQVPYGFAEAGVRSWLEQGWFARQMHIMTREMQAYGFPVIYDQKEPPQHSVFRLGEDYHPYNLTAFQTTEALKQKREVQRGLSFPDGNEKEITNNLTHVGLRLDHVLRNSQSSLRCSDYPYDEVTHKPYRIEWDMSQETRDLVAEWFNTHQEDLPQFDGNLYYRNEKQALEWGNNFFQWIREQITKRFATMEQTPELADKYKLIQQAEQLATSLYETYHLDATNYHCGVGYYFDYVLRARKAIPGMGKPFSPDRIVPHGEIALEPGSVTYFLGPNMAGKSSVMRSFGYAVMLDAQGLPQTGDADVPEGLAIDSVIGAEKQQPGKSLLSALIPGINRLIQPEAGTEQRSTEEDRQTLYLFDELGRRTSKEYGQTMALSAPILSLAGKSNYVGAATHYHSTPKFAPLLNRLGIQTQFVVVEDHRVRVLEPGEETHSNALAVFRQHAPGEWLNAWPGEEQSEETQPAEPLFIKPGRLAASKERLNVLWRKDLFGDIRERRYPLRSAESPGLADDGYMFDLFSNPELGPNYQAAIEQVGRAGTIQHDRDILEKMDRACRAFLKKDMTYHDLVESMEQLDKLLKKPEDEEGIDLEALRQSRWDEFTAEYTEVVDRICGIAAAQNIKLADKEKMVKGLRLEEFPSWIIDKFGGLMRLKSFTTFAEVVNNPENGYCKVEFSQTPELTIHDMWNPLLRSGQKEQVANDVAIDFTDGKAGQFINGENYSGKTNSVRTMAIAAHMALCTGYAPAAQMQIHPDVRIVSLTQPVADEETASSMAVEARDRFKTAVDATEVLQDNLVITILDEPGAPTSPEEAGNAIVTLFDKYNRTNDRTRLVVTSQCDQVPAALDSRGIDVDLIAFRLLSETPFKASPGTADSNALEVMRSLGLDEKAYTVMQQVYEYVMAVEAGGNAEQLADEYALKINLALGR